MTNRVAVVIPTRNRPQLVIRAVRSAQVQTHQVEEIIVVIDGEDDATVEALRAFDDRRVRVIVLPESGGSNNARNIGAASATSDWLAFLDDDDEWMPQKIQRQLAVAGGCQIVSCRFFAQSSKGTMVWPRRLPGDKQRFGDYLFARKSVFNGEAAILTSTILVRKSLFDIRPFSTSLRRHQDADWVIRATSDGAAIVYATEALVKFKDDIGRARISTSYNWQQSLDWIRSIRHLVGRRAYAGFVLTSVGPAASDKREWKVFAMLLYEAFKEGRPTVLHLALYLGMWAFPQRLRQRLRAVCSSLKMRKPVVLLRQEWHS